MTERGTTFAGRPQTSGLPRVHRFFEPDGRGTIGDDIRLGQTWVGYQGIRPTPPAVIHGSVVANGATLFLIERSRGLVGVRLVGPQRR